MTQETFQFEPQRSTQTQAILRHLQSGKAITPLESLQLYGCFRLTSRIYDIKKLGFKIESKMVDVGNGKHVAEYTLLASDSDGEKQ